MTDNGSATATMTEATEGQGQETFSAQQFNVMANNLRHLRNTLTNGGTVFQARKNLASQLGVQFEGKRDIYQSAGYKKELEFTDYEQYFSRGGVAKRIVKAPPDYTWRLPPTIKDGDLGETDFTKSWDKLVNFGHAPGMLNTQKTIWHYIKRADTMSGKGQYGILVIGFKDGLEMTEPLQEGKLLRPPTDLLYLSPYDQGSVTIDSLYTDPTDRNFGKPKQYSVLVDIELITETANNTTSSTVSVPVHATRIIHIAEELENNEIYGTPRLKAVYNYLEDLLKVTSAAGESAYFLMNKGLMASTRDEYDLPEDPDTVKSAMEDFMNELQRVLLLQGVDFTVFGGEIVDPTGNIKSIISLISATTGIPQRILLGAEAGQLASSMDEINWASQIEDRQKNFAWPVIIRPLINTFIYVGLLPMPESGDYQAEWPSLLNLSDLEKADMKSKQADIVAKAVGEDKLPIETVLKEFLGWSKSQIEDFKKARKDEVNFWQSDFPSAIEL